MATRHSRKSQTSSRFMRAANVELDVGRRESLDGYVLTSTGRRVLRRIAESISGASRNRAWTLTGSYGTGKTAFAVFTTELLSRTNAASSKLARQLLNDVDPELAGMLGTSGRSHRGLIPIPITGTREPVEGAVLRGLESTVNSHLNGTGKTLVAELKRARRSIAAGKLVGSRRVTELVSDGVERLCGRSRTADGVFLVLDELGKLLEYANHHSATSDLFTLQELAECFSRSDHRCLLMGILHQDFGAYATRLASEERAEWDKIRGRFEDIPFEEPGEEMLRLVSTALSNSNVGANASTKSQIRKLATEAWRLGLAPGTMSKSEFLAALENCAPLHPVVAVSIGTVFRRLAQNERSAFSFLSSNEPFGLTEFVRTNSAAGLYGIDRLYDYLSHSIRDSLYASSQSRLWAETESILESSLADATASDVFLVKAIGLINAIGRDERIRSSREILTLASKGCLAKPLSTAAFSRVLKRKLVVDRKFNQTLALWEGSDVDIDEEIRAARRQIDRETSVADLAERYFPCRPVVARRHSFETGTFRYFNLRFVNTDDITRRREDDELSIAVVLPESSMDEQQVRRMAKSPHVADRANQLVCLPADRRAFSKGIFELAALEYVRENVKTLEGDRAARRELAIRTEGVRGQLSALLSRFLAPDENPRSSVWFHRGRAVRFGRKMRLQDLLSEVCDDVFNKSPRILNELINRRQLSSAAAKARRTLIERMFSHRDQPDLGLEKAPPEKSIYLSVIKQADLHSECSDAWDFHAPKRQDRANIQPTWAAIEAFFKRTESGPRTVAELFSMLGSPPYGILEGPLPILFCAALLVHDNEVALYKDGTFVPSPGAPDFELLMKHPERYTVQRWHVTGVRAAVFRQLARLFGREFTGRTAGKIEILDLVRPLLRFYQSLNNFTMQTNQVSREAIAIRSALGKATQPDTLLFAALPESVGLKPFSKSRRATTKQVEEFIDRLRLGLIELQTAYDRLLDSILASFRTAFSIKGDLGAVRRDLAKRAEGLGDCSGDPLLKSFVERVGESELADEDWLETLSSLLVLSQPANWKDGDLKRFQSELRSIARLFHHVEAIAYSRFASRRAKSGESLRIGITQQNAGESEKVVYVSEKQASDVDKVADALESALKQSRRNNNIALAALAKVTQRRMAK